MSVHAAFPDLSLNPTIYVQLLSFTIVLLLGLLFTQAVLGPAISLLMRRRGVRIETRHSVRNLVNVIGIFMSFTVALEAGNFGSLVTVLGAVAAALTVAIGFGMRDQISNVVAGFFIFLKNPFYVGDYIETGTTEGVIEDITILHTVLEGSGSQTVIVPNHQLTMEEVRNYTREGKTKGSISVSLANEHLAEGTELLRSIADEHADTQANPEPKILYHDEGGEIAVELQYWLDNARQSKRVRSEILAAFNEQAVAAGLFENETADA